MNFKTNRTLKLAKKKKETSNQKNKKEPEMIIIYHLINYLPKACTLIAKYAYFTCKKRQISLKIQPTKLQNSPKNFEKHMT